MASHFTASTKEVMARLGLRDPKTLLRRRTCHQDCMAPSAQQQFLEPGVHFRPLSPDSNHLVWDLEKTAKAWDAAMKSSVFDMRRRTKATPACSAPTTPTEA